MLLTHTHGDHWNGRTLAHLARRGIPFWCHADHRRALRCDAFTQLLAGQRVSHYEPNRKLDLGPGLACQAVALAHDEPAYGFRFEGKADLFGHAILGYAADLGSWSAELARLLADVDILALEFNHDVHLELSSGRSQFLIRRVLGRHGHLSNEQASELLRGILSHSTPGRLRHLVLLHLSRECNRRHLAEAAARAALGDHAAAVHTARQDRPLRPIGLQARRERRPRPRPRRVVAMQPCLPGFELG